jgi:uncharacterized protein YndB with AHSA1/START domain
MPGRKSVIASVTIAKPPEQVFAYLSDVTKHAEWSPKPFRIENLSGPAGKGTTFTSYGTIPGDKNHRNDVEITEYDPPSRFALRSAEKDQYFDNTFEISAEGAGSKVVRTMDMPAAGAVGLLLPLLIPLAIRPDVQKGLNKLKTNLEAQP